MQECSKGPDGYSGLQDECVSIIYYGCKKETTELYQEMCHTQIIDSDSSTLFSVSKAPPGELGYV